MDVVRASDRARPSELGRASFALLYDIVGRLLDASVGAVIESNFQRDRSELELEPLVSRADAVLLHCETSRAEIERRYAACYASGERHPGHHDLDAAGAAREPRPRLFEPVQLQIPTLRIDTTNGYRPTEHQIKDFLHREQPSSSST